MDQNIGKFYLWKALFLNIYYLGSKDSQGQPEAPFNLCFD